ncbi:hypothetical protein LCGC14_1913120 [marine sediment metagenome]|uniref:Uncharacterized protein n=1 Tax=marine sediment metagenome TaxID=412755 RepID=A0A0F9FTL2_9ZZZZ
MAKIKNMLGEKAISGFRGTLDFYYYMGIACVRRWPTSPGHRRTPAVQAGWQPFTEAVALWTTTPQYLRDLYQQMATGSGLTNRDLFIRSYMAGWKKLIATVDELE